MARRFVLTVMLLLGTTLAVASTSGARVWNAPRDADVSLGAVELAAPAEQVYATLTDYGRWPQVFQGIRSTTVVSGGRDDARVQFRSLRFERPYTMQFRNEPGRLVRFAVVDGVMGSEIRARLKLVPVSTETTRLDVHLETELPSVLDLVLPERLVQEKRAGMLRTHLEDLRRFFSS
ncbi:MAG: SRPBCC family protein [Myxococcota bacterium]